MPTGPLRAVVVLSIVLAGSLAARAQDPPRAPDVQPAAPTVAPAPGVRPAAPVQPLPYSHKTHVALGLQCRGCHVNPDQGALMTYPPASACMTCHATVAADRPAIQKLAALESSGTPIPWVRVYRLPDYVYWSHAAHIQTDITCEQCHGPVAQRDVLAQETNIVTMLGCVTCHNKRQVFTDCGDCHAPRQEASGRERLWRAALRATL